MHIYYTSRYIRIKNVFVQLKVFELIVDALMVMHPISFSNLYDASMSHPPIRKFKFRKSPTDD